MILVLFPRAVISFANPHEDFLHVRIAALSAWSAKSARVPRTWLLGPVSR